MIFFSFFFYLPLFFSALIRETDKLYEKSYKSVGRVGYYFEYLGEVPRSPKPELKSEGYLPPNRYPTYNKQPSSLTEEEKSLLYQENYFLATKSSSNSGTFDILDKDGYLYYNNQVLTYENGTSRKLYRHLGSVNNYLGEVSDNEPAIVKRISLKPRIRTYSTTGLYAPPGEVISLRINEKELQKVGSLKVSIGPIHNSGSCIEIGSGKSIVRMPLSTVLFTINASLQPHVRDGSDYIFYLGSFFGGPIFAFGTTFSTEEYTFTISGAVPHSNFILGFTTPDEFEYNDKSTAPFFVLDVYTKGISFIGPRSNTGPINYHSLYDVADYWNKVSAVSNQYSPSPYSDESITMNHEPYIPAGAAVAIRGGAATQCPVSWLPGPLLYKYNLMDSANWGSHHEYNHHFQNSWGFYGGSETTNNAITLAAYTFYSRNSQKRTETSDANNNGWNDYNSATWVLKKALAETHENYYLDVYIVLLHCLGPDLLSLSARTAFTHGGDNNYYTAVWTNITHLDFTYYVETLYRQRYEINKTIVYQLTYGNKGYSNFIPIACRYQTGLGYMVNGKRNEIHTMRPFIIKNKVDKVINFTQQMVIPDKFAFTIKSFTNPEHGKLTKQDENVYVYHPDADHILSGKMTFLVGLTKVDDPDFLIDDIEMYIEFQQSSAIREKYNDEDILDLELYVYPDDVIPEDPIVEYNNGFSRSIDKIEMLNNKSTTCFSSTGNTELVVPNNPDIPQRISVLRGKFEVQKGKFRIGLRASNRTALFLSYDGGKTYSPECKVFVECANEYFNTHEGYPDFYVDKEFEKSQWIYFKIVMCHKMDVAGRRRFAEIGIGSIQEDGNVVVTSIHNARGEDYQNDPDFYPDDVFPKFWSQAYSIASPLKGTILDRNYERWGYQFYLENMCDDDDSNGIKTWPNFINDTNPFMVLVDLGSEISANSMTIYGIRNDNFQAKKFILYGGTDRNDLHIIANVDNAEVNDKNVFVKFELQNIRYYKLEVYDTYCTDGRVLLSFRYIQFSIQYQGRLVPIDNQTVTLYNGWETIHYPSANFGKIYKSISNIDQPSKALFKFKGTSFGINAYKSPDYGRFYVFVDGQKIGRIRLDEPISRVQCIYIVENLEDTEHEVLIEDISGLNLDSFIIIDDKYLPDEIFSVNELPPIKSDLIYAEDTQTPSPSPELINPELPTSDRTENYISITFECDIVSGNIVLNHDCSSDECSVKSNIWAKLTFEKGQIALTEYLEGNIIEKDSVTSNTRDLINSFEYDQKTRELKYKIESTFITLNEQQTENNLICIRPPTESPKPTQSATQSPTASQSPTPIATYSPEPIPDEIEFVQALGNYADNNYLNARLIATSSFTCTTSGDLVNYPINNAFSTNGNLFWVGHRPVTETFRPYIIFDFKQTFTLEALIYTSGYRSQTYTRTFDGFPFKLNIYASVNNGPLLLKYRFSGNPPTSKKWDKTLYEFEDRLVCDKLKIEFVNVTENDSFNLAKARHPSAQRIMLLKYIPPTQTPLPTVTPIYVDISSDEIESVESSISSEDEVITTTENPTEDIFKTLEPPPTPDSSILSNLQGLINITCDKFEYTDWEIEGTQGAVCVKIPNARHGSYTENKGAKAAVTFIGTKVHLLGWKQKGSGTANIYIDNEMVGTADFNIDEEESKSDIVFTSRDLPYGEHFIEIEHNDEQENKLITFGGIYVDPLPKQGGFTLEFNDAFDYSEFWIHDTTTTPHLFYNNEQGAYITFRFFGTRFWLTGVRGNDVGSFQLTLDDDDPVLVWEIQDAEIAQNNKLVLLY
ncbi:hypothetical protein M9Y10_018507 [Tritrichomonas musculus]|uniref:Peptidase M60 domain-containing protein n=1 Tax=Tritrichomonas musculus TaxID=1915356 RepID=A0ABR2HML5_9EUKA